jgi:hypothetical protein
MHEIIPVAAGVVVGLAVTLIANLRLRAVVFVVLCVAVGALVSFMMGEMETGLAPLFVSFDALLVWLGGLGAALVAGWWRSRGAAQTARR